MMITQHSVIINNYRMIKKLCPAHSQAIVSLYDTANQRRQFSNDRVVRSSMLFSVENLVPNIKEV
jgi:hypothetical protein